MYANLNGEARGGKAIERTMIMEISRDAFNPHQNIKRKRYQNNQDERIKERDCWNRYFRLLNPVRNHW